jgi:hypothetical protein
MARSEFGSRAFWGHASLWSGYAYKGQKIDPIGGQIVSLSPTCGDVGVQGPRLKRDNKSAHDCISNALR